MEKDERDILKENIKKFIKSAEIIYNTGDFTSSAILYFKAFFAILDLVILKRIGKIPKDHSERFRILESGFSNLYSSLDKLYHIYRNTYTAIINKYDCDKIKNDVERIIKEQRIFEDN